MTYKHFCSSCGKQYEDESKNSHTCPACREAKRKANQKASALSAKKRAIALPLVGSQIFADLLVRLFVGYDPKLYELTVTGMRIYSVAFLIMGYNIFASSFFTALGDGITSALISFLRTLLFQVAAVLVLPELLGIDGVWLAVTAAELASLAVSFAMFRQKDRIFHYRSE